MYVVGEEGVVEVVCYGDVESVVIGIVGCVGLLFIMVAIVVGKDIVLVNKEMLIVGVLVVLFLVEKMGVKLLLVDLEYLVIF